MITTAISQQEEQEHAFLRLEYGGDRGYAGQGVKWGSAFLSIFASIKTILLHEE
jgi:hypothetical protein